MSTSLPPPASTPHRLTRSQRLKILSGVCGGIAEYLDVDVTVVRVVYVITTIFSAFLPGVLAYVILAFVMPRGDPAAPAPPR